MAGMYAHITEGISAIQKEQATMNEKIRSLSTELDAKNKELEAEREEKAQLLLEKEKLEKDLKDLIEKEIQSRASPHSSSGANYIEEFYSPVPKTFARSDSPTISGLLKKRLENVGVDFSLIHKLCKGDAARIITGDLVTQSILGEEWEMPDDNPPLTYVISRELQTLKKEIDEFNESSDTPLRWFEEKEYTYEKYVYAYYENAKGQRVLALARPHPLHGWSTDLKACEYVMSVLFPYGCTQNYFSRFGFTALDHQNLIEGAVGHFSNVQPLAYSPEQIQQRVQFLIGCGFRNINIGRWATMWTCSFDCPPISRKVRGVVPARGLVFSVIEAHFDDQVSKLGIDRSVVDKILALNDTIAEDLPKTIITGRIVSSSIIGETWPAIEDEKNALEIITHHVYEVIKIIQEAGYRRRVYSESSTAEIGCAYLDFGIVTEQGFDIKFTVRKYMLSTVIDRKLAIKPPCSVVSYSVEQPKDVLARAFELSFLHNYYDGDLFHCEDYSALSSKKVLIDIEYAEKYFAYRFPEGITPHSDPALVYNREMRLYTPRGYTFKFAHPVP